MLAPLMLPETLIVALVILPVRVHVLQQRRLPSCLQYLCDVRVGARWVAVGFVRPIAAVRPESMDGPAVRGAGHRTSVPELSLKELPARRIEAAGILDDGGVLAGQLGVAACWWTSAEDVLGGGEKG